MLNNPIILVYLFVGFSTCLMFYISIRLILQITHLRKVCTETTVGTYLKSYVDRESGHDTCYDDTIFYPIIKYTVNSIIYENKSLFYDYVEHYKSGDTMTVHFNPSNPNEFWIDKYLSNKFSFCMLGTAIFTTVLLILSLVF